MTAIAIKFNKNSHLGAAAVTPSNSTVVAFSALFVGGAGNLAVVTAGGDSVTFTGVLAGTVLNIAVTKVMSTGTTATNITGLK